METLSPDMITQIYSSTSLGVSIMLAAAGLGSALGWGLICMKYRRYRQTTRNASGT